MTRLRAPEGDGELLESPPLAEVPGLIRPAAFPEEQAAVRREILYDAPVHVPWVVGGHQPELFHPGVWVKNFALAGLALRLDGIAVNLVVDNDTVKSTSVRVPVRGADGWPVLESVPFDRWQGEAPWEERYVAEESVFSSFGERIAEKMRPWGIEPLAGKFWPEVLRQDGPIGERFAAARRKVECEWGCSILDIPLSRLCDTHGFDRFVLRLLNDLPRFVEVHNAAVAAYRRANGIKSRSHPVPDLARDGDWLELPLWAWRKGDTRRERVFARLFNKKSWLLRAGDLEFSLGDRLERKIKLRSRALATTMFARLFLADVFLHGIGGAKYDELADIIIGEFFGVEPPPFAVLSATSRLPLPLYPSTGEDVRRLQAEARQLEWNPQRSLPGHPADAERRALLESRPTTRRERRVWFARLRHLLDPMRRELVPRMGETTSRLALAMQEAEANALLRRRDYSFVLYPEASLRGLLAALAGA